MTLDEFVKKYNDKKVEAGGSAGAEWQCVDLANQYISEVLGLPKILWTNAIDFPKKAGSNYDYIKNTPTGVPQKGDLIIWGSGAGQYGHIAIFLEGNVNSFKSFDQNWPLYSPCHVQGHYYKNVIGWMRPKGGSMGEQSPELKECLRLHDKLMAEAKEKDEKIDKLEHIVGDYKTNKEAAEGLAKAEKERFKEFRAKLGEVLGSAHDEPVIINEVKRLIGVEDQLNKTRKELETKKGYIDILDKENEELRIGLNKCLASNNTTEGGENKPVNKKNKEKLTKIGTGALIAGAGAALTYLVEALPAIDLGVLTPVVVAVLSVLVNVVRKLAVK